ncbi:hypothetical protein HDV00_011594 [Rhizophlyctis rosea]|nr:hypothetical protein HDV00_011594 [Rhizophlyctis rosea]
MEMETAPIPHPTPADIPILDLDEDPPCPPKCTQKAVKKLPPPTEEVLDVMHDLQEERHVTVVAIPGAGKTSVALEVARHFPEKKILLIVYNACLKKETRVKVETYKLTSNMDCHSFHACAGKYLRKGCCDDVTLQAAIYSADFTRAFDYDILIIDEAQDMKDLYYAFVARCCHLRSIQSPTPFQIMVLGDPMQCVYGKMGADRRFLTLAKKLFFIASEETWVERKLTLSHRLTKQHAKTINALFSRGQTPIRSNKDGPPVKFLLGNAFTAAKHIARDIGRIPYSKEGYEGDIMIIAASVQKCNNMPGESIRNGPPIVQLCKELTNSGHLIHVSNKEDAAPSEKGTRGKILITNQCQLKGTERQFVFVLGVDMSLWKYYSGGAPISEYNSVPSGVFVAISRSSWQLVIHIDDAIGFLPFFDSEKLYEDQGPHPAWEMRKLYKKRGEPRFGGQMRSIMYPVTEMCKYIEQSLSKEIQSWVTWLPCSFEKWQRLQVSLEIECRKVFPSGSSYAYYEAVDDIIGMAISTKLEKSAMGTLKMSTIATNLKSSIDRSENMHEWLEKKGYAGILTRPEGENRQDAMERIFKTCIVFNAVQSGYYHRMQQINQHRNWLTDRQLRKLEKRGSIIWSNPDLRCEVTKCKEFEHPIQGIIHVIGRADVISDNVLWEVKCLSGNLSDDHRLQLMCYAWLLGPNYRYKLINLLSGECIELVYDRENIEKVMKALVEHKTSSRVYLTDEKFLQHRKSIWEEVVSKPAISQIMRDGW